MRNFITEEMTTREKVSISENYAKEKQIKSYSFYVCECEWTLDYFYEGGAGMGDSGHAKLTYKHLNMDEEQQIVIQGGNSEVASLFSAIRTFAEHLSGEQI